MVLRFSDEAGATFILDLLREHIGHPIRYIDIHPEIKEDEEEEDTLWLKVQWSHWLKRHLNAPDVIVGATLKDKVCSVFHAFITTKERWLNDRKTVVLYSSYSFKREDRKEVSSYYLSNLRYDSKNWKERESVRMKWFCVLALLLLLSGCSLPPTEKELAAREGFAECGNVNGSPIGWTVEVKKFGTQYYCDWTQDDSAVDGWHPSHYSFPTVSLLIGTVRAVCAKKTKEYMSVIVRIARCINEAIVGLWASFRSV